MSDLKRCFWHERAFGSADQDDIQLLTFTFVCLHFVHSVCTYCICIRTSPQHGYARPSDETSREWISWSIYIINICFLNSYTFHTIAISFHLTNCITIQCSLNKKHYSRNSDFCFEGVIAHPTLHIPYTYSKVGSHITSALSPKSFSSWKTTVLTTVHVHFRHHI